MWFSQQYPQHRGLLFEVNNDNIDEVSMLRQIAARNPEHKKEILTLIKKLNLKSKKQSVMKRIAMGMIPGLSDLILIEPIAATTCGIELKASRSRHSKSHIETQLNWGKKIIESGGFYFMLSELDTLKMVTTWIMENTHTEELMELMRNNIREVEEKLRGGAKTVTF
jgi:hypothetical protein